MDFKALAELLYPGLPHDTEYYESFYAARNIGEGAKVTRVAPSPTGYLHLGGVYQALADERLAHLSGGVFMLRIEDTDSKREIEGGIKAIIDGIKAFGIAYDEGVTLEGSVGAYGPYKQSLRADIYKTFAKKLVSEGKAYPCFCTEERLAEMRHEQEANKENPGYYGKYAVCRDLSYDEVKTKLDAGERFVLRFREQPGKERIELEDCARGSLSFPANDMDMVMMKSDGIPVYHFAHVVDDHLMKTTHVVRGEEWLATYPFHASLFAAFGWEQPRYIHTATIMKNDKGGKRKLSKRKDPEAAVEYFVSEGYPREAVLDYLMMLLNSNYEEWRAANENASYKEFPFSAEKMSHSGALFDLVKLYDICKNRVSRMTAEEVYEQSAEWSAKYAQEWNILLTRDKKKSIEILSIGRGGEKPRKDIGLWSELPEYTAFFFDESFKPDYTLLDAYDRADALRLLGDYGDIYTEEDEQSVWFDKIKAYSESLGYAPDAKTYKKNKDKFKGHAGDISAILRIAVTGKQVSPDLHRVMAILGREEVLNRLRRACANLENK